MTNNREETAVSEEVELKPCPKCKTVKQDFPKCEGPKTLFGQDIWNKIGEMVVCCSCSFGQTTAFATEQDAIKDWNSRPAPDPAKDVEITPEINKILHDAHMASVEIIEDPELVKLRAETAAQSQLIGELEEALKKQREFCVSMLDYEQSSQPVRDSYINPIDVVLAKVTAWREGK